MDEEYENFIMLRCKDAINKAGIDVNNINLDACIRSYKAGFMEALNLQKATAMSRQS